VLPSVGDKNPQISLSRGVVHSQNTFHLVSFCNPVVNIVVIYNILNSVHFVG